MRNSYKMSNERSLKYIFIYIVIIGPEKIHDFVVYFSGIGSTLQVVGYKVGALFGGGLLAWLKAAAH